MKANYHDNLIKKSRERKQREQSRRKRRMELGYDGWQQRADGSFFKRTPKGIQNWYDTKTLVKLVSERMDRSESAFGGKRECHINGKWMLQIRGKHMRRLLKAKPEWKQVGRKIVEVK